MTAPRCLSATLAVLLATAVPAQEWWQGEKRLVQPKDYGRFETLRQVTLSPDGAFCAWTVARVDGSQALRVARLGADGVQGERRELSQGARPAFSDDSGWLAYRIEPSEAQREKAEESKKPAKTLLGLLDLGSGETEEVAGIDGFAFSPDGKHLAMRRAVDGDAKSGRPLLVRELATGIDTTFGHVGAHAWHPERPLLALVVDAPGDVGNGVAVYDPHAGRLRTLDSAETTYKDLSWRRDGADLAVLRAVAKPKPSGEKAGDDKKEAADEEASDDDAGEDQPLHTVLAWRGLDGDDSVAFRFDPAAVDGFPQDFRIAEHDGVRWAEAGDALFVGTQPLRGAYRLAEAPPGSLRAELDDPAGVEVWHPGDIDIIPRQKKTLTTDRSRSDLMAVWLEDGAWVSLGDETCEQVSLLRGERHALGRDNTPHEELKRFGPTLFDVHLIDTRTGARQKILEATKYVFGSGPGGAFVAYRREGHLWCYDVAAGEHRNLTGGLAGDFVNDERNVLTDESPGYGVAGWSEDGREVLVHSRWDVWALAADGSGARRLTSGASDHVRYRVVVLDEDLARRGVVDLAQPVMLSVYGDRTKKSGYARRDPDGAVHELLLRDAAVSQLTRAEDAAVHAWVEQRFDDAPDAFVAGAELAAPDQVSVTNASAAEFAWGRAELVDFENAHGEPLQGALYYPADYDPTKRYPVITYIYEMRSQNLHRWAAPSERGGYNLTVFTQQGYFVFQPDIVYRPQNPGLSALECVVPAVQKIAARDDVDETKIGLAGHSWGAYQTAFLTTHSDVFAAGVAGAPLTNMISMSMSIYWNSGQTDTWIFHESQGRMDQPFWRDLDTYVANSPIFGLDDMTTPLLIAFGDEDGAVDWQQGVELYNAARLVQKPVVMLVYPGENHGLRKKPNQVDYHHRILEWFGHHLKGEPAPAWITAGQSWDDRQRELEALKKRAKDSKSKPAPKRGAFARQSIRLGRGA